MAVSKEVSIFQEPGLWSASSLREVVQNLRKTIQQFNPPEDSTACYAMLEATCSLLEDICSAADIEFQFTNPGDGQRRIMHIGFATDQNQRHH